MDAPDYKIRDGARFVTKAVLVVAGVREDVYSEVLGARVTDCENEEFWSGLFKDLKEQGLTGSPVGRLRWSYWHSKVAKRKRRCRTPDFRRDENSQSRLAVKISEALGQLRIVNVHHSWRRTF